jgi:hypothetical protein
MLMIWERLKTYEYYLIQVNWLSNKEKGLIDFSDFGSEIKKETKPVPKSSCKSILI